MASVSINGKKLMRNLTVTVDTSHLDRQAFGIFRWRLGVARVCLWVAVTVLRCNVEVR